MRRAVLDAIASGAVVKGEDMARYVRCTLLWATEGREAVKQAHDALDWLKLHQLVR